MKKSLKFIILFIVGQLMLLTLSNSDIKAQPSGKLSGLFFMDYYYNVMRDTGIAALPNTVLKGGENVNGFQIRRIYLTYDYKVNDKLSSRLRLESDEANFTSNLAGNKANKFGMFVKDAYIKWNYFGRHDLYIGIQGPPTFEISERIWENRYIEKTTIDVRGICPSRDQGISLRGSIDSSGMFKYWLMVANGTPSVPEADKYKRFYGHLEVNPFKNFVITLFGEYQARAKINNAFIAGNMLDNNITTAALFFGYRKKDKFSGGIEVFHRSIQNGYKLTDSYTDQGIYGYSVFATYHFSKKVNAFARYDKFEPNNHTLSGGDTRDLIMAGVAFKPASNFIISPNIYVETHEKTAARTIKNSVSPRITLSWSF